MKIVLIFFSNLSKKNKKTDMDNQHDTLVKSAVNPKVRQSQKSPFFSILKTAFFFLLPNYI